MRLLAVLAAAFAGSSGQGGGPLDPCLGSTIGGTSCPTPTPFSGSNRCATGSLVDERGNVCPPTQNPTPVPAPSSGPLNPWICLPNYTASSGRGICLTQTSNSPYRNTALAAFLQAIESRSGPSYTACAAVAQLPSPTLRTCFTPCEYDAILCYYNEVCRPYLTIPPPPPLPGAPPPPAPTSCEFNPTLVFGTSCSYTGKRPSKSSSNSCVVQPVNPRTLVMPR